MCVKNVEICRRASAQKPSEGNENARNEELSVNTVSGTWRSALHSAFDI